MTGLVSDILYGTSVTNDGLKAFVQSLVKGRMGIDEARAVVEHSPRLAVALCEALSVSGYGNVDIRRLLSMASEGTLNGGVISRAFSH